MRERAGDGRGHVAHDRRQRPCEATVDKSAKDAHARLGPDATCDLSVGALNPAGRHDRRRVQGAALQPRVPVGLHGRRHGRRDAHRAARLPSAVLADVSGQLDDATKAQLTRCTGLTMSAGRLPERRKRGSSNTSPLSTRRCHGCALNVAPTDGSTKFNTIRIPLIPVACWRLDDPAFAFDSSFVSAKFRGEMVPTDPGQDTAEDDGLSETSGAPDSPLTTLSGIVSQNPGLPRGDLRPLRSRRQRRAQQDARRPAGHRSLRAGHAPA